MSGLNPETITSSLEDIMHESFMPYAEYVILERALPRVEDGLKPVQRRILYSMYENQIFPDTKHKKCARIVGDTMGKYHPHGDSSIYEALARMAQDYSMGEVLVDGQGNFGSIDGDGPAAMRYTEARMAPLAMELLRDIDKDTVDFTLNFDDTCREPVMMPSRFPNLLVNGSTGIAVGLATNIPPHNLGEVVDATVYRMQHPDCSLQEIMQFIKGPDFPTGGVVCGTEELIGAYETGRGKIMLRAKTEIESKGGKDKIVITELPYEVREAAMLRKIDLLRTTKKEMFSGIDAIRSETDRTGIRAVIELKRNTDAKKMLDCLFKYSDLQVTYGINLVAIAEGQPKQLGLLAVLDYYTAFQRKVVTRRIQHDIEEAQEREHKLAGLIAAVLNLDLVIKLIREAENTREAKSALMKTLNLTGVQAQAILDLRLSRLTKLEIAVLRREYDEVVKLLQYLSSILKSPAKLDGVIIAEMEEIRKKFGAKRRTKLSKASGEIVIDQNEFKVIEECSVVLTRAGALKRMSNKAFVKGAEAMPTEEKNLPVNVWNLHTDERIRVYTKQGNLYTIPVESVREAKYRDAGAALGTMVAGVEKGEQILTVQPAQTAAKQMLFVTRQGMVKLTEIQEFDAKKSKILACGLKEKDALILCEERVQPYLLLITKFGLSIRFAQDEISMQGRAAKGVSGIKLESGDEVIFAAQTQEAGGIVVVTDSGYMKYSALGEYELQGRGGKGLKTVRFYKNNGQNIAAAFYILSPCVFRIETASGHREDVSSADVPKEPRFSRGEQLVPALLGDRVSDVALLQNGM